MTFIVLAATLVSLLAALAAKSPCLAAWPSGHMPEVCFNDVQMLWHARGLGDHVLPYVHGGIQTGDVGGQMIVARFTGHELEYPVLTGLFVYVTSLAASDHTTFLLVTAAALAPLALAAAWLLTRLAGRRALLFAVAPSLVWYAFLNWDLLVVAATVAALYAWRRNRFALAAMWLGVGANLKLWPVFLLVPLVVDLWLRSRHRDAVRAVGAVVAAIVVPNVPFMVADFHGWLAPFTFQSYRASNLTTNSLWFWTMPFADLSLVNRVSWIAVGVAFAAILGYAVTHTRRSGQPFAFVQVSAAMTVAFIVLGKVHSPQYALWILPFVVLLRVPTGWVAAFFAADLWLYAQWLGHPLPDVKMFSAVFLLDAVLALLAWVMLRAPLAQPDVTAPDGSAAAAPMR